MTFYSVNSVNNLNKNLLFYVLPDSRMTTSEAVVSPYLYNCDYLYVFGSVSHISELNKAFNLKLLDFCGSINIVWIIDWLFRSNDICALECPKKAQPHPTLNHSFCKVPISTMLSSNTLSACQDRGDNNIVIEMLFYICYNLQFVWLER